MASRDSAVGSILTLIVGAFVVYWLYTKLAPALTANSAANTTALNAVAAAGGNQSALNAILKALGGGGGVGSGTRLSAAQSAPTGGTGPGSAANQSASPNTTGEIATWDQFGNPTNATALQQSLDTSQWSLGSGPIGDPGPLPVPTGGDYFSGGGGVDPSDFYIGD